MRQATWYWRLWWWFGYHGLYQINWWWRKKWEKASVLRVGLFKKTRIILFFGNADELEKVWQIVKKLAEDDKKAKKRGSEKPVGTRKQGKRSNSSWDDCHDRDCRLFVPAGSHSKGTYLCKYARQ